ncbi:MAG: MBL fold metallo-hydrolase [Bacteroidetes bacterium]|nr:MBL fold metallo-hydrolase [Bacteroidota bacterium]
MKIKTFTFNPFTQNTYVLSDESGECVIIDPGCYDSEEEQELENYISAEKLKPVHLLNTHCHVDHVFGNYFAAQKWNLGLEINKEELPVLRAFPKVCELYGLKGNVQPEPEKFLDEGQTVKFGNTTLEIFFTPGHSPGSICFYSEKDKTIISGDVLFQNSIGRSDLPGGDPETLLNSIRKKLFVLPDEVNVFSGHGPSTTIGWEKRNNPFAGENS